MSSPAVNKQVRDWIAALDGATGKLVWKKFTIPAPGEPGSETWKDKNNAWQTGGGAMWVTGTYDPATNQTFWGTGNPVPMFDPTYRPGDNLFTNSVISWNPDDGKMNWFFQFTPGDMWDYDEVGTHIMFDATVNGVKRTLFTHSARNGYLYTFERANGQHVVSKPYFEGVNWTKGIDQKTGKPVDYDPNRDLQVYAGTATVTLQDRTKKMCPSPSGGNNFWPTSYSQKTGHVHVEYRSGFKSIVKGQRNKMAQELLHRREVVPARTGKSKLTISDDDLARFLHQKKQSILLQYYCQKFLYISCHQLY